MMRKLYTRAHSLILMMLALDVTHFHTEETLLLGQHNRQQSQHCCQAVMHSVTHRSKHHNIGCLHSRHWQRSSLSAANKTSPCLSY